MFRKSKNPIAETVAMAPCAPLGEVLAAFEKAAPAMHIKKTARKGLSPLKSGASGFVGGFFTG